MNFSLGKTLWKSWLRLIDRFIRLFFIADIVLFILIVLQVKPDLEEFKALLSSFLLVLSAATFFPIFPTWMQAVGLGIYFKFARQIILKIISSGAVDYNFVWSLPKGINELTGVPIKGEFVDFVFWSGFILCVIFFIDRLERGLLVFLAKTLKIGWAREFLGERLGELAKAQNKIEAVQNKEMLPSPPSKEIKERIVFKPKFFKDRLWYLPFYFLLIVLPVGILFFLGGSMNSVSIVLGSTFLLTFLVFLPFFFWEATTRFILEKDRLIVKTFFFLKKEFIYHDIKNITIEGNNRGMETLIIYCEKQTRKGTILKKARLFLWPLTTEKMLEELKPRLNNVNIDAYLVKRIRATRSVGNAIVLVIIIGLFVGFMYFIIYQAKNRPKLSDQDCADRLGFWISDKPKVGFLETKGGFEPEINKNLPFYFFIDAQKTFSECNKTVSFTIRNTDGNIIFQKENLPSPKKGIAYYYWKAVFKETGGYFMKINYTTIPAKEIHFSIE